MCVACFTTAFTTSPALEARSAKWARFRGLGSVPGFYFDWVVYAALKCAKRSCERSRGFFFIRREEWLCDFVFGIALLSSEYNTYVPTATALQQSSRPTATARCKTGPMSRTLFSNMYYKLLEQVVQYTYILSMYVFRLPRCYARRHYTI